MAKANTSRYAVLGMLSWGPKSGYDIRKELQDTVAHFWSESFGQIYPVLRQLVKAGLAAEVDPGPDGRADRKVYRLTDRGRVELERWLAEPVHARPVRNELLLKLWFGSRVPVAVSVQQVQGYRAEFAARLETYRQVEVEAVRELADEPDGIFFLLTLRMGLRVAEACVRWCDEALAALTEREAAGRRPRAAKRPRRPGG
jgi:DNA-binding PadR family transcriptional regulator